MHTTRIPVYRQHDHELLGFVQLHQHGWHVITVFGSHITTCADETAARTFLHTHGLAILNQHWHYYEAQTNTWHVVLIQEASPTHVHLILGYYAMPGIPTKTVLVADLLAGDILQLDDPSA